MHPESIHDEHDPVELLTDVFNTGIDRAAASLSDLVGEEVQLFVPRMRLHPAGGPPFEDAAALQSRSAIVVQEFRGTVFGRAALIFPQASAMALGDLLAGDVVVSADVDAELSGILLEVGNIMLNGVLGSLSNVVASYFDYSLPTLFDDRRSVMKAIQVSETMSEVLVAEVEFRMRGREFGGTIAVVLADGCSAMLSSCVVPVEV